jgi:dipeptidyl-peptidase-3
MSYLTNVIPVAAMALVMTTASCNRATQTTAEADAEFSYTVDRFADIEVLRYKVPGFEELSLNQKKLVYHLTEAALTGRDILWDQNCKYNLPIRQMLEAVYTSYTGNREDAQFIAFEKYLKQVEFANGIHHHYSMDKFVPEFSQEFLAAEVDKLPAADQPTDRDILFKAIFDPDFMSKRVNQAEGQDLIATSACNFYEGVTQSEVENYYSAIKDPIDHTPISYGLNSRMIKVNGRLVEDVYKIGGRYSAAIEKIVGHLNEAAKYAENEGQRNTIAQLIEYYTTGDLKKFDEYSITWVQDTISQVDFINGFIESYGDPLGMRGSWESIVNFKNQEASHRTEVISDNASWFEQHSPTDPRFQRNEVKGVSAKVITAAILAGDSYPATPIGINLPNANWIRAAHGSKSVTIENITDAYDKAAHGNGFNDEFVIDQPTRDLMDKYLFVTDNLHTDLHECLGHGSGKLLPGVDPDALKAYGSTLEEARADLFALYFLADRKLLDLGLLDHPSAYQAEYYKYLLNGLMTQLMRIEPGKDVEEAHMRNRKLISEWVLHEGQEEDALELVKIDDKTYLKINSYEVVRDLFGQLLAEIQRIKSEGDYEAGRDLVEKYGVKVDPVLHKEVLERYAKLNIAPYKGFVNPVYTPITNKKGEITDIKISYDEDYLPQVIRYSKEYSTLTK